MMPPARSMTGFGAFRFDPDRRLVFTRDGEPLHLTRKAFDLLALLIEEAPRVVAKPELHERLWPGTFVSDSALVGLVKELRRVLNDPEVDETYIRTSHGVGYAFTGRLTRLAAVPGAATIRHWLVAEDRRIPLNEGEHLIGRDPSAQICFEAAGVSRGHARIVVRAERAELEDLGSKNGTLVQSVQASGIVLLHDGDRIQVGPVSVIYRASEAGMSTETIVVSGPSDRPVRHHRSRDTQAAQQRR